MIVGSNPHDPENNFTNHHLPIGVEHIHLASRYARKCCGIGHILYVDNKWSTLVCGGSFRGINSVGDSEFKDPMPHFFPIANPSWVLYGPLNKTTDAIGSYVIVIAASHLLNSDSVRDLHCFRFHISEGILFFVFYACSFYDGSRREGTKTPQCLF